MAVNKTLIIQGKFELTPFTGYEKANIPIVYKDSNGKLQSGTIVDSLKGNTGEVLVLINKAFDPSCAPIGYVPVENILWVCDAEVNDGSHYNWEID